MIKKCHKGQFKCNLFIFYPAFISHWRILVRTSAGQRTHLAADFCSRFNNRQYKFSAGNLNEVVTTVKSEMTLVYEDTIRFTKDEVRESLLTSKLKPALIQNISSASLSILICLFTGCLAIFHLVTLLLSVTCSINYPSRYI